MLAYMARRALLALPVLLGVIVVVFLVVRLVPGDPVLLMAGENPTPEFVEALRRDLGLDKPLTSQLWIFLGRLVSGDMGRSVMTKLPVAREIAVRFPATLELAVVAMMVSVPLGVVAGVGSALRSGTLLDAAVVGVAVLGITMPAFWLGLLMIMLFSVGWGILPPAGRGSLAHLIMPALTLGAGPGAIIARMTRSCLLEVLGSDYVRTARAKGLCERVVILKHALRNSLIPVVTVLGLQFGSLLAGAVIVESVFCWPGLGQLLVDAVLARDYPVVQGVVLVIAVVFVLLNLAVDLLYSILDPRIRYG